MAEGNTSGWMRVESRKKKKFYYFNVYTGESVWKLPDGMVINRKSSKETANVDSELSLKENAGKFSAARINSIPSSSRTTLPREPSPEDIVDMEDERWLEDEEIAVDMDISADLQQQLVFHVQRARQGPLQRVHPAASPASLMSNQHATNSVLYEDHLYLVLDTNVLLSHLDFLMELKDCAIRGVGRPVLVVPWTVMQELDGLKVQDSIGERARRAIQFLHSCFAAGHPRIRGQTMDEVNTELSNVAIENNDDRILHCCLVYQLKVQDKGGLVVLFSNDTQLCSKSLVNGIKAVNRKVLLPELRSLCKFFQERSSNAVSYAHTAEYAERVTQQVQLETAKAVVDDILCQAESLLREGLAVVVEEEMRAVYGDLWLDVVLVKPPWTFSNIVHLIEKHWIAVFSFFTTPKAKAHVRALVEHCKTRHKLQTSAELVETLIDHTCQLLRAFSTRSNYQGVVTHCLAAMEVLLQKLTELRLTAPTTPGHSKFGTEVSSMQLHPTLTAVDESVRQLVQSPPSAPTQFIPWLLGSIYDGVNLRSTRIVSCCRERRKSGLHVGELRAELDQLFLCTTQLLAAINNFVCTGDSPSITVTQELVQVIDKCFTLVLSCPNPVPLDLELLLSYWMSPDGRSVLQQALAEFNQVASALQSVGNESF